MKIYQFSNSSNWSPVWSGTLTAAPDTIKPAYRFFPIPDYVVPIALENPIIAINASAPDASDTWKYAGTAFQKIFTGIGASGDNYSFIDSQKFYLDQVTILRFQKLSGDYSIALKIPYWIRSINLGLWEYIGPVTDTTEQKLDEILLELAP